MIIKSRLQKFIILSVFLLLCAANYRAQTVKLGAPRQEKLLNGMNLLVWNAPETDKITVKLRIHSGSAFDPKDKEGTMAMLADILFPNEAQREYFTEDLGGSLDVSSNYDYIQINATANADQFLTVLEIVSNAVVNTPIDKDTTAKIRAARLEKLKELEKNPSYIADRTVAKRLFGDFPYGRAQTGTSETVARIDFADLLFAKQRFLTADNATLAVYGSVKPDLAYRAVRRYFGAWTQADKKVPATFRQPDAPDKSFLISSDVEKTSELRFAFRGLARSDKDFAASEVLTRILQNRLRAREGNKAIVRQNAYVLPGFVLLQIPDWNVGMIQVEGSKVSLPVNFFSFVNDLFKNEITAGEVEKAKSELNSNAQNAIDARLDADTYKLDSAKDETNKPSNVSLADVQRVAERWRKEPFATALLVKPAK